MKVNEYLMNIGRIVRKMNVEQIYEEKQEEESLIKWGILVFRSSTQIFSANLQYEKPIPSLTMSLLSKQQKVKF